MLCVCNQVFKFNTLSHAYERNMEKEIKFKAKKFEVRATEYRNPAPNMSSFSANR